MQANRISRAHQLVTVLLMSVAVSLPAHAQRSVTPRTANVAASFAVALNPVAVADRRHATRRDMSDDLRRVYGDGEWTLLWSHSGVLTTPARAMIAAISQLDDRGLAPEFFGITALRAFLQTSIASPDRQIAFDTSMTIASLRVLRALRGGQTAGAQLATRKVIARDSISVYDELMSLTSIATPQIVLDAAEPSHPQYRMLKTALATYRAMAATDSLARARRIQIELTMERWRWMPRGSETTAIIVNIPEFRLYAYRTDSLGVRESLSMDVVVGHAGASHTPIFSDSIRYLEFAPFWNVPASVVQAELLPIARRDPYLLKVNNYEFVTQRGRLLPMTAASVRLVEIGKAWIRQLPGGTNALGKVKFMFPNEFDVYLHDTPVQRDFLASRRDASHGCIRIANPEALARLLLRDQSEWTTERVAIAMNVGAPHRVTLTQPVPVHLIYTTAVAREDGTVAFFEDIYKLDAALAALLASSPTAP